MDRYTKFILTIIAIGLIGNLFEKDIIKDANAATNYWHVFNMIELNCSTNGYNINCSKDNIRYK